MKALLIFLLSIISVYSQTFKICDQPKTDKLLAEVDGTYLTKMVYGPTAEGSSLNKNQLYVPTNQHPVIFAAHTAFSDHRRLVLSPDIVWLMISQGFATHIRLNEEVYRKDLVNFEGKKKIEIRRDSFKPGSPDNDWFGVIEEFNSKIKTNKNLEKVIFGDFTTTDSIALTAYRVAHMDSVSKYYDYSMASLCGIPEITLEGTTEDWEKILTKVQLLNEYKLQKWVNGLKPILQEFVNASKGKVNKKFWQSIYKTHEKCGGPYISGWLMNFFPYTAQNEPRKIIRFDKDLNMSKIDPVHYDSGFPTGQSKVDFIWHYVSSRIKMEINGGFLGVIQNKKEISVKPNIAWAVAKKNNVKIPQGKVPDWMKTYITISPGLRPYFKNYPSVKSLYATLENDQQLAGVEELQLLQYLSISGKYNGSFLKYLKDLKYLDSISCDWNLQDEFLPLLQSLKLYSFGFGKEMNPNILKYLPETVSSIYFKDLSLTAQNFEDLQKYKNLKSLSFAKCIFSDKSLQALAKLKIEELSISECNLPYESFSKSLASIKTLKDLSVTDTSLKKLSIQNPILEELTLTKNEMESISFLEDNQLKSINLRQNQLTSVNLNSNSLTYLDISENKLASLNLNTPKLHNLNVSDNLLTSLTGLKRFPLNKLDISDNKLHTLTLPATLTSLRCFRLKMTENMKKELAKCLHLTEVILYSCSLNTKDDWIFKNMKSLERLVLSKEEFQNTNSPVLKSLLEKEILFLW